MGGVKPEDATQGRQNITEDLQLGDVYRSSGKQGEATKKASLGHSINMDDLGRYNLWSKTVNY